MKKNNKKINKEIRVESVHGDPVDTFDMLNKYGTYEIQPTADTENLFPTISQGNPSQGLKTNIPNSHQPK